MPASHLVLGGGAPQYVRETKEPDYLQKVRNYDFSSLKISCNAEDIFWKMITRPNIASKKWIFEQYDSQVRTNTVNIKGDAAIIRIKELPNKAIAVCTDCNSRYTYLNPYKGAMIAVAEAARNVVCVGAEPVAITNCLNFGNPYDPEVYWTFKEAIRGMGDACKALNTPVTGGNVSFHNESKNRAINPTPTIGMLGVIDDLTKITSAGFKNEDDAIYLIGNSREELGGSEFVNLILNSNVGDSPDIDIEEEKLLQKTILELIRKKIIHSAHDCSEGGLAICLAEKSIFSEKSLGAEIDLLKCTPAMLFGESQSRVVVTLSKKEIPELEKICDRNNVPYKMIGMVINDIFRIKGCVETNVDLLKTKYENAISEIMNLK